MKYTEGPWKAFTAMSSICVGSSEVIERVEDACRQMHVEVFGENRVANAKLIADTPELLMTLQRFVEFQDADDEQVSGSELEKMYNAAIRKARRLVEKHTGKEG